MAKLDQYMQGRTEGMELALRIAKDKGIEELEKEVRFRQKTGISLNVTRQELNKASNKIKAFGFGKQRCERYMKKMEEGARYLMDDLATWDDYSKEVEKQLGIKIEIHWND